MHRIIDVDELMEGEEGYGNLQLVCEILVHAGISAQVHPEGYVDARPGDCPSVAVWFTKPGLGLMLRARGIAARKGSELHKAAEARAKEDSNFYGPNQNADMGGAVSVTRSLGGRRIRK